MIDNDKRILTKVAHMYYDQNMTQQEIADKLLISRPSISRLLQKARQEGIVDIKVNYEDSYTKLEDIIEKAFGLHEVIIIPTEENDLLKNYLAEAAARYLERVVKDGDIIGVSWGTTLAKIPKYIKTTKKNVTFVPLIGGAGQTKLDVHSNAIAISLAKVFGGKGCLLHAPVTVESVDVKKTIVSDKNIKEVLELAAVSSMAVVGIGAPMAEDSIIRQTGYYNDEEFDKLKKIGAVCDICWTFIDAEGKVCPTELNERIIGISIENLKKIPIVLGVAGGISKHEAILAAVKGRYISVLITDEKTAEFLASNISTNILNKEPELHYVAEKR